MAESLQNALLDVELQYGLVAGCAFQCLNSHSLPIVKCVGIHHAKVPHAYSLGAGLPERPEASQTPLQILEAPSVPGGRNQTLHAPW